jgi:hypothetical protein
LTKAFSSSLESITEKTRLNSLKKKERERERRTDSCNCMENYMHYLPGAGFSIEEPGPVILVGDNFPLRFFVGETTGTNCCFLR